MSNFDEIDRYLPLKDKFGLKEMVYGMNGNHTAYFLEDISKPDLSLGGFKLSDNLRQAVNALTSEENSRVYSTTFQILADNRSAWNAIIPRIVKGIVMVEKDIALDTSSIALPEEVAIVSGDTPNFVTTEQPMQYHDKKRMANLMATLAKTASYFGQNGREIATASMVLGPNKIISNWVLRNTK